MSITCNQKDKDVRIKIISPRIALFINNSLLSNVITLRSMKGL